METLVNKLAMWQAERKKVEDLVSNDPNVAECYKRIEELESQITETRKSMMFLRSGYDERISEIDDEIKHVSAQIIEGWNGEKKTIKFKAGTLKFRTTSKLEIYHPEILLEDMFVHLQTTSQILKYLSGFNKTAVKKYIGVHPQDADIVELIATTSAKLEQKE